MAIDIEKLGEAYGFEIIKNPQNRKECVIKFKDGAEYRFTQPDFMTFHKIVMSDNPEHEAFIFGLQHCLIAGNDKAERITPEYVENNKDKMLYMWSPLIRGLLL